LKLQGHPFYDLWKRQDHPAQADSQEKRMTSSGTIHVEALGGSTRLTLDRTDRANALTGSMLLALRQAVETARASDASALILTGSGKVFSAGADLDGMKAGLGDDPEWERLSAALAAFPGLTIAALNGTVAGGAMGMVLACDLRIAVPSAQFFYPVMRLGYRPQPSDPIRLSALVGPSRAKMILLAGQRIGADQALAWGLIDRIVPPDSLLDTAMALAADALGADHTHVAQLKRMTRGERP
jgi:enoyl-CoA hydratase/carnithine racemase